jgi:hypothetical protein
VGGSSFFNSRMPHPAHGHNKQLFAEPMGQPAGVGADQKVVNFEQISIRKRAHAPLDRGDVFREVWRQFDLNIHGDRS